MRKPHRKYDETKEDISEYYDLFVDGDFAEKFCTSLIDKKIITELFSGFENNKNIEAFLLANVEEKAYEEIAIIQNISNAAVRKRIQRARQLLQEKYHELVKQDEYMV